MTHEFFFKNAIDSNLEQYRITNLLKYVNLAMNTQQDGASLGSTMSRYIFAALNIEP